ncbi:MAG: serine dehydratase subunit alpha family protein, partial [Lachnospiraceae bacterium]|nr:serine dehydratase subunit alpha family protein [Lachnospiraceae bacterium]
MLKTDLKYGAFVKILEEELKPAMGCTEPIALAYAAAVARKVLGEMPDKVAIGASGSIIKNVKSVIVPNTNRLKGIPAAAAAGIVGGDPDKELEVIAHVTEEQIKGMRTFLDTAEITVEHVDNGLTFDIIVTLYKGENYSKVRIVNYHTNIVLIEKNGEILQEVEVQGESEEGLTDRSLLSMADIWDFINTVDIADIKEMLDRQIACNMAIAEEGIRGDYGANIGKVLIDMNGTDIRTRARAMAAAGSDARMNGCELPVIINSGSGNQGITASVPVIVYARELGVSEDKMYRALALSDLTTIHQKTPIGRLSAFCGAVSAGAGAGAGIAYLNGGDFDAVIHTVINAVAIVSGMVCDGAKASCAAKIAEAVDAGIIGYNMHIRGQNFEDGDGIVKSCV